MTLIKSEPEIIEYEEDYTQLELLKVIPTISVPLGYIPKACEKNESGKDETEGSLAVRDF